MKGAASRYRVSRLEKCLSREGGLPPRRRAKTKANQAQQQTDRKLTVSRGSNYLSGFAKRLQTVLAGKQYRHSKAPSLPVVPVGWGLLLCKF